ncbi:MAG: SIR2 family protein [Phycisphaerae bacterium]
MIRDSGLPFEGFMEILAQSSNIDPLLALFTKGSPNHTHRLIAKLMTEGHALLVVTTNFDLLIERALSELDWHQGIDYGLVTDPEAAHRLLSLQGPRPSLLKIHGSVDSPARLGVTLRAISSREHLQRIFPLVQLVFSTGVHRQVLVLGYSCSDVFDILPAVHQIEGEKKMICLIDHTEERAKWGRRDVASGVGRAGMFRDFPGTCYSGVTDDFVVLAWQRHFEAGGTRERCGAADDSRKGAGDKLPWKEEHVKPWLQSVVPYKRLCLIGDLLKAISEFGAAEKYYQSALSLSRRQWDDKATVDTLMRLGFLFEARGDEGKKLSFFAEAADIGKGLLAKTAVITEDPANQKLIRIIGNDMDRIREIQESAPNPDTPAGLKWRIQVYKQLLGRKDVQADHEMRSGALRGQAECWNLLGEYDEAIELYRRALDAASDAGLPTLKDECHLGLGHVLCNQGGFCQAIVEYKASQRLAEQTGNVELERKAAIGLAEARRHADEGGV